MRRTAARRRWLVPAGCDRRSVGEAEFRYYVCDRGPSYRINSHSPDRSDSDRANSRCRRRTTLSNGGYALNDICDRAIDKINQPGGPIPAGRIGVPHALLIGSSETLSRLSCSQCRYSRWCIALTLSDAALLAAYAVWFKRLGPLKNILIWQYVASGFLIGAYNWDRIDPTIAILAACAFLERLPAR